MLHKSLYRGRYVLHKSANKARFLVGFFLVITASVVAAWLIQQNTKTVYHLPDEEIPTFVVPSVESINDAPKSADVLVATSHEFTIETYYGSFEVSCPVIRAEFGEQINQFIISELNNLVSCVQYAVDNAEELPVTKLSYQSYYSQDILTLVLMETLKGPEKRSFIWIYDLKENRELSSEELPARFMDISYTEFLYVTDKYIGDRYWEYHSSALEYLPDTVVVEQQYKRNLRYIQTDPLNMLSRYVFPTEEGLYLLYELPIVAEEYDYEVPTKVMIEPADGLFRYIDLLESKEAVRELLFDTAVSVMGADDQIHAEMVRTAFVEHPEAFVAAAIADPDYAIQRLLLYASQDEKQEIVEICTRLKALNLSEEEFGVISLILSDINEGVCSIIKMKEHQK